MNRTPVIVLGGTGYVHDHSQASRMPAQRCAVGKRRLAPDLQLAGGQGDAGINGER